MRLPNPRTCRGGATLVEMAVVIGIFLMLVLGMLDLGIGVFRYNIVSHAARQGARMAIVHGSMAPTQQDPKWGPWGPETQQFQGDDSGDIAQAMQPFLIGLNPSDVTITVTWIATNEPDGSQRVVFDVDTKYHPMMTFIFGKMTLDLHASSTMYMAH